MWKDDVADMKSLGISIVRIGEFAWNRLEPKEGVIEFEWLDQIIELLDKAGLKVVLGTPSATPPRWVLEKFPDLLAYDENGRPRKFGSRRHYCFSHQGYKELAAEMAARLSKRYGDHPALFAWQTDNEYGCHDTVRSYSPLAKREFQNWLSKKYKSVKDLNKRWGNIFWSMEYSSFNEIGLPNLTVTEPNPSHKLDFFRFCSEQVVNWNQAQITAIRLHSDRPIFHNYMGRITEFDHFKLGESMEISTWDSYPLGFLEDRSDRSESFKQIYQYSGDPDFQAFHHDLYRGVGKGRWGIMEQQPGPVNWAPYNPKPAKGMVKTWTLEAMAHGAEFVAYFRWRQLPFAQEQMHSALKRSDNGDTEVLDEIRQVAHEIKKYGHINKPKASVGLIFDYESQWAWEVQPQGQDFDYFRLIYDFYCGLRRLGLDIDLLSPNTPSFDEYDLLLVPGLFSINDDLVKSLLSYSGELLMGPRTNTKTKDFHINPMSVSQLMNISMRIDHIETLRPSESRSFEGFGTFHRWLEKIHINDQPGPPIINNGNRTYLSGWPDNETLKSVLTECLDRSNIPYKVLDEGVRNRSGFEIEYIKSRFEVVSDK
jgi:beta-galactosidase